MKYKTPIPEVELLSYDDITPVPAWLEEPKLPNLYRDYLQRKIDSLDAEDILITQRNKERANYGKNIHHERNK